MKTYEQLIEELMEESPVNAMGGGFSVGQASSKAGNLAGYDPVMGMHRRKKKKRVTEMFAGCPVFTVGSEDYAKCMHGRTKYERWSKKLNMEEMDNKDIRTYAHRNPGKPIIIKDSTYGTMSWFVPRQNVNESVLLEGDLSDIIGNAILKSKKIKKGAKYSDIISAINNELRNMKKPKLSRNALAYHMRDRDFLADTIDVVRRGLKESVELDEYSATSDAGHKDAKWSMQVKQSRKAGIFNKPRSEYLKLAKKRINKKLKENESVELDEYRGEYDPEYEHEMEAHDAVKRAENKKGKPLTKDERKHHEDKAYHDIGYRDRHAAEIEKKAGKKLTYKEMMAAKAKTPKHKIPLGSAGNPAPLKSKK